MRYYDAYESARSCCPKEDYRKDYAAILESTFDNAFNIVYDDIEFEYEYGSNEFTPIEKVRVDSVINYTSSMVVDGDDFKTFIFMPDFPKPRLGMKFKWGENYWLVISTNTDESLSTSAEVRRCNNVLRFFDQYGNKIYEPCIIDTTLRFTKNIENYPITIGSNEEKIWCQRNSRTELIKPNDKFLFGTPNQRVCFRVYGAGTKNVLNTETMNDNSPSLTEIYIHHYQYNRELDDLQEGFANAYAYQFSLDISDCPTSYHVGDTGKFTGTIYKGENVFEGSIVWTSSDPKVINVDAEGNFSILQDGQATIVASMEENNLVTASLNIEVDTEDSYEVVVSPDIEYILQGNTQEFSCYLYKNGEQQQGDFTFKDNSINVPRDNYNLNIIDANHFSITNYKKYMYNPITINCTLGEYSKDINILLRGLY